MGSPGGVAVQDPWAESDPAAAAGGVTVSTSEPVISLSGAMNSGSQSIKVKNWDGSITELIRFKYKTMDGRTLSVDLPGTYRAEKMTKASWDTLFRAFSMDEELRLEKLERDAVPDVSALIGQFMAEIRGSAPQQHHMPVAGTVPTPNPAAAAMDHARSNLPSMGMQLPPMPASTGLINP